LRPHVAQLLSPNWPSSGVYSPPGTGFSRVSKVLEFVIRRAESARMSLDVRKPKETPASWLPIGCEMFMLATVVLPPHRTLLSLYINRSAYALGLYAVWTFFASLEAGARITPHLALIRDHMLEYLTAASTYRTYAGTTFLSPADTAPTPPT